MPSAVSVMIPATMGVPMFNPNSALLAMVLRLSLDSPEIEDLFEEITASGYGAVHLLLSPLARIAFAGHCPPRLRIRVGSPPPR